MALVPAPRLFVILNGAVHRGYWSAFCGRVCDIWGTGSRKDYNTQDAPRVDGVSYYNTWGGRGAPSCLWDWFNWDTGSPVFVACRI